MSCSTDTQWFFCLWKGPTNDIQCAIQVCTLCTVNSTLHSVHRRVQRVQCRVHSALRLSGFFLHGTLYTTLCTVNCTLHSVYCRVQRVQCRVHSALRLSGFFGLCKGPTNDILCEIQVCTLYTTLAL